MSETEPRRDALHLVEAIADGAAIDWKRAGTDATDPAALRSLALIDSVFREYTKAAGEVQARLSAPLIPLDSGWGPLRVLERIGTGSFGQVFRAFDRSLARDVALKILRDPPRKGPGVPEFLEEARRLARLRHPGVLVVYGVAVHQGRAGIWTELVPGRTLEAILDEDGVLAPDEAARIGIALCGALSAVHAAGLIHRDIKTQNVMREESGRVVLTDFGAMDERFDEERSGSGGYGSLLSVAPEILRGGRASPASDVYSIGVLLYRILSHRYPLVADSPRDLLLALDRGRTPIREAVPSVAPALAAVVDRALDPDPARRFTGPNAMAQALQAALDPTLPARPAPRESYRPSRRRESMGAVIGACVAISALVAAGVTGYGIPWLESHFGRGTGSASAAATSESAAITPSSAIPGATMAATPSGNEPESTVPAGLRTGPVLYRVSTVGSEPLSDGGVLRSGDQLFLTVETGADPVVCYVLDEDAAGNDYVLFPLPGYRVRNPLAPGTSHRLPDGAGARGRTWQVDSENGREDVVVVTSLAPLPWFDRMIRDIPRASGDQPEPAAAAPGLVTRGLGRTAPPPPTRKLAAVLDRLRASQEFRAGRAGLWRIRLASPSHRP